MGQKLYPLTVLDANTVGKKIKYCSICWKYVLTVHVLRTD